jgi:hypothetical protein
MANGSQGRWVPCTGTVAATGPRGDGSESVEENWKRSVSAGSKGPLASRGARCWRMDGIDWPWLETANPGYPGFPNRLTAR